MIHTTDPKNILEEVYPESLIAKIDYSDMKSLMSEFVLGKCKIVLNGNNLLERADIDLPAPLSEERKEKYLFTKYRIYEKPVNIKQVFEPSELLDITSTIHAPKKNRFVPASTKAVAETYKNQNLPPSKINFGDNTVHLYHSLDYVYHKPNTVINVVFRIR